jgi:hypothetical protein
MDFETIRSLATEYPVASYIAAGVVGFIVGEVCERFYSKRDLEAKKLNTEVKLAQEETRRQEIAARQERITAMRTALPGLEGSLKPIIDSYNQELAEHRQKVAEARQALMQKRETIRGELFEQYKTHSGEYLFDDHPHLERFVDAKYPDEINAQFPPPQLPGQLRELLDFIR